MSSRVYKRRDLQYAKQLQISCNTAKINNDMFQESVKSFIIFLNT